MLKRSVIEDNLREIFPDKDVTTATIERIGGMSNMNYKVALDGATYVLRIPGIGAEGMVERANEEKNSIISGQMNINPPVLYFNAKTGVKLAEFIPNAETLHEDTIQQTDNLLQIAEIYKKLHRSRVRFRNGFNIFYEIEKYDILIDRAGAKMYGKNKEIRRQVMALEDKLNEMGVDLCACHNDAVPENFIKSEEGRIFLIDWEYSGMNDPMADLAALFLESNFSEEKTGHQ
ncbi:MAG: phosphotransferase [Prevotellaceae bacterium]|nr:phosphotransferase [Prevotellaceae bacterium]